MRSGGGDKSVTPAKLDANAGAYGTYALARAALAAGSHTAGSTIRTASRAAVGDGGEGEWQVVAIGSYVDNGGTILTGGSFAALRKFKGPVVVEWFGAIAHPTTDGAATGAQIQAALDDAATRQTKQIRLAEGYYRTEIGIVADGVDVIGAGRALSFLKRQSGAGDFVLKLIGANLRGVAVDGTDLVPHAIWAEACATKVIEDFFAGNALWDAIWLDEGSNNNALRIRDGLVVRSGTDYDTGTASGTLGASTVTISGAADLTTLGFRERYDYIYFPTETGILKVHEIRTISASSVEFHPPLASELSGAAYLLSGGAGIQVTKQGDNLCYVSNVVVQHAKGGGVQTQALYGTKTDHCVFESNFVALIWGMRARAEDEYIGCVSPSSTSDYFEANTTGISLLNASAIDRPTFFNENENIVIASYVGALRPSMFPESGTWTPSDQSGAGLTFAAAAGSYTRSGRYVTVIGSVTYPVTADATAASIGGMPFRGSADDPTGGCVPYTQSGAMLRSLRMVGESTRCIIRTLPGDVSMTNADLSGVTLRFEMTYRVWSVAT